MNWTNEATHRSSLRVAEISESVGRAGATGTTAIFALIFLLFF
jgi:hypothetical protein